jgi:hypothetical protein
MSLIGRSAALTAKHQRDRCYRHRRLKWHIDMQGLNKPWDFFGAVKNKMISGEIPITLNPVFKTPKMV